MMKVYAIRHGLTELNKKGIINGNLDDTLASEGIEQAKEVASTLPKTIKYMYSSSLGRARETAQILNNELDVPLTFRDELKEVDFGVLNGTPYFEELKEKHSLLNYDWRPSGECFEDVKKRTLKILEEIKNRHEDEEVLIVGHGGTIRMMHLLETGELLGEIKNVSVHSFDLDKIFK